MNANILNIKRIYLEEDDKYSTLLTCIEENGREIELFAQVESQYSQYLTTDVADAIIYLMLPVALNYGFDIYSELPVSEILLHNIRQFLIPALTRSDNALKEVKIEAPTVSDTSMGFGVGTAVSGGVDSFYTIMEYSKPIYKTMQLTHLMIGSASWDLEIDGCRNLLEWENKYTNQFERYHGIAESLNLPLIKIFSNYYDYLVKGRKDNLLHGAVHPYITMANVLTLKKLWKIYYFSSSYLFEDFQLLDNSKKDAAYYDLLTMYSLSRADFICINSGAELDRVSKTVLLAEYPLAQKYLHPCFTHDKKNCSKPTCNKCLRALLALDYYDKLDKLAEVFDIPYYRQNRIVYFKELCRRKDNYFLKDLYKLIKDKYPSELNSASLIVTNEKLKNDYEISQLCYDMSLRFLKIDGLKRKLINLFCVDNSMPIVTIGRSRIGDIIINLVKGNVEFCSYDKIASYQEYKNICLILHPGKKEQEKYYKILSDRGFTRIYTLDLLQSSLN